MKKIIVILGALFVLAACSTMQGLGDDISNTGQDISDLAKKIGDGLSGGSSGGGNK